MLLELSNFSTLFEIAATLNVAFIAVEYSTSYTIAVARNVFKFFDKIEQGISKCKNHIDDDTINGLNDVLVNGHSISHKIEKAKRESVVLKRDIKNLKELLCSSIKDKCRLKCFSMICLHLFLYCLVACLTMAYDNWEVSKLFWMFFSILSIVYVSATFRFGEIKGQASWLFQNVKNSTIAFFVIFTIGLICAWLLQDDLLQYIPTVWNTVAVLTSIYPFIFFILFILVLRKNSKEINDDIDLKTSELERKCAQLEKDVKQLSSIHQISIEVDGLAEQTAIPLPPQRQLSSGNKKKKKHRK